jgi:hypothetical protein
LVELVYRVVEPVARVVEPVERVVEPVETTHVLDGSPTNRQAPTIEQRFERVLKSFEHMLYVRTYVRSNGHSSSGPPKLSEALDTTSVMDTPLDNRTNSFPRRSQMSTYAINPGSTRTRHAARRSAPAAPMRLTRRGRVLVVLLVLGVALAVLTVFGSHSAATGEAGVPVQTRTVEVGEGDTLWMIASEAAEPGEVRELVHQIEELNALTGSALTVGQEIAVPVG